jgi:hypothetical protein
MIQSVNSGKALDIANVSTADGAQANQWSMNGQGNQQFKLIDAGNGYFKIMANHSQKCLDIQNQSTANGALLVQSTCRDIDSQKFTFTEVGSAGGRLGADTAPVATEVRLLMYPNPATDVVTILGAGDQLVSFINLAGQTVLTARCTSDDERISVQSLPVGQYTVYWVKQNRVVSQKLLIAR